MHLDKAIESSMLHAGIVGAAQPQSALLATVQAAARRGRHSPAGAAGGVEAAGEVLAQLLHRNLATRCAVRRQVDAAEAADAQQLATHLEALLEVRRQPQLGAPRRGRACRARQGAQSALGAGTTITMHEWVAATAQERCV